MHSYQIKSAAAPVTFVATFLAITAVLATAGARAATPPASEARYLQSKSVPLGAPERWDYLTYDTASGRLYVTHSSRVDVLDGRTGSTIGTVAVPGANGVAVIAAAGKGYAGSREHKSVIVFDLQSLHVIREIAADEDTDGIVFDPMSKRIFVMEGDPHRVLAIDSGSDAVLGRVELGAAPEFATVDDNGKLYVNLEDQRAIARIDTTSLKIEARWPVPACEAPHGLAIDIKAKRLFASCANDRMVVVDATNGRVVAEVPIGHGSDAAVFDAKRKLAFSSNNDGTLSVIQVASADHYETLASVTTVPSARTLALDPESGRIYLTCGERIEVDPAATNPRKRYGIKPGSVRVLFLDPTK